MRHNPSIPAFFRLLAVLVPLLLLGSCGKNEFDISGRLKGAGNRNLIVLHTALSDKHDELVNRRVPCSSDAFSLICPTRYPSIVWIAGSDGRMLHALYAEKGDHIVIEGEYAAPLKWKISGNKASERYSGWMSENAALLEADNPAQVNAAAAGYVKKHPEDIASALILLTVYHRDRDEKGFDEMWQSLRLSDDEKARLLHTAMMELGSAEAAAARIPLATLTMKSRRDSVATVNPALARATILYFWRRADGPHKGILAELSAQPADVQVADIFLDLDTVQWRYLTQADTFRNRQALWAFGGEMNVNLTRLAIPSDPFIIVADRKGRQLYRGSSPSEAVRAAAKAK